MSRDGCWCGDVAEERVFEYDTPPRGEPSYAVPAGTYRRKIVRCATCGHFRAIHSIDLSSFYQGQYAATNYGDAGRLREAFERIMGLEPARSDNAGRVRRFLEFAAGRTLSRPPTLLDVGSGLCVFAARLKREGWACTAVDPDPAQARHARETAGVNAVCGDVSSCDAGRHDAVSLNKVLEHVRDPASLLARCRALLNPGGFVYLEVPDGETAARAGREREEFYIDHWHMFSPASLAGMIREAGGGMLKSGRLVEPSGKYTLWAFVGPVEAA